MIRKATLQDLDRIMFIYDEAKKFMRKSGNPHQWNGSYPERELVEKDIKSQKAYVLCDEKEIPHVVFYFSLGEDPTYKIIRQGSWLNNEPYGVIHRIASDGVLHGTLKQCVDFCKTFTNDLRIDTHHDNKVMQHTLEKNGFICCGIIYLENGEERIAYHLSY